MYTFSKNAKLVTYIMMAIGAIALVYGFATDGHRTWPSLLLNNFFWMAVSLGAIFFLAVQYAAEAGWATGLKRIMQAQGSHVLFGGIIMLIIFIAGAMHWNHIYHWMAEGVMDPESHHYDKIIAGKQAYLNVPFFLIRAIIYIAGWAWAGHMLRKLSLKEDMIGGTEPYFKSRKISAIFLVFFAVTSSMAAWDWIMSIDTHWFSTLFGWYVFISFFVSALSVLALLTVYLKKIGHLEIIRVDHLHDLGKFMFAFSIFWTYLWFSQFMLYWYSNIPEEVVYFQQRITDYKWPFFIMLGINFALPVFLMMTRDAKRAWNTVAIMAVIIVFGHWMDFFVMIMPATVGHHFHIGFVEIGGFIGFGGFFFFNVLRTLAKAPLIPKNHPMLKESEIHHI